MKNTKTKILKFVLLLLMFSSISTSKAQDHNYLFYYGEPLAVFSKETGFSNFTLLYQDPKTEEYKLDKALAKSFKFLWQYTESKTLMKFAIEKFEFNSENDACTHEAKVILKGIEQQGFYTSKPLKKRVDSTPHEATKKEKSLATKLIADYLRRDEYKASAIDAIIKNMDVSAVNLRAHEKNSLIVQANFEWHKKFISMLVILTPGADKQLAASFSEIHTAEMETEAIHIRFNGNIDMGDGQGEYIFLERDRWENAVLILLSRPNNTNQWKEELSFNEGC